VLDVRLEETARRAEAGVGEHDVELPERVERRGDHALLVLPLGDVAADRERALRIELTREPGELLLRARREHQPVALTGCMARGRGADAARRAGDQEDGVGHEVS
jgi:hypothetical protein